MVIEDFRQKTPCRSDMFENQIQTLLAVEKPEEKGLHSFMDWSPEAGSTRCLAFAGGGELFSNLFDRQGGHLLSTSFSHDIDRDGVYKIHHCLALLRQPPQHSTRTLHLQPFPVPCIWLLRQISSEPISQFLKVTSNTQRCRSFLDWSGPD